MQTVVIDSSIIIKWLNKINEQRLDRADQILTDAQTGKIALLALARQEDAALVTDNPKHQGKSKDVKVIPLADY